MAFLYLDSLSDAFERLRTATPTSPAGSMATALLRSAHLTTSFRWSFGLPPSRLVAAGTRFDVALAAQPLT